MTQRTHLVELAAAAATIVAAVITSAGITAIPTGTPGAHSAGERLFPWLGNGGYDALSYDVGLAYIRGTPKMTSQVTMTARSTQSLSSFSMDSGGQSISSVAINGRTAHFHLTSTAEKLVITPASVIPHGTSFRTVIHYVADRSKNIPTPHALPAGTDWPFKTWVQKNNSDGFAILGQTDRAHLVFPSNDIPSDKARLRVSITAPDDLTGISNGSRISRVEIPGHRAMTRWSTRDTIPTDVVQIAVGNYRPVSQTGPHGLPITSYVPASKYAALKPIVSRTPAQLAWVEKTLGITFPFERYGVLVTPGDYDGVALESATLSTFGADSINAPAAQESSTMVHEMIHQYFGDTVSVRHWDDMWISEGHASYYANLFNQDMGYKALEPTMKALYEQDATERHDAGPTGRLRNPLSVLFEADAPGELLLYGLQKLVGPATFHTIETTFFQKYKGSSASTQDFIDTAKTVSGQDLTAYVTSWIYGATTPAMPGHPDWKSTPATG